MSFEWPLALVGLVLVPLALIAHVTANRRTRYSVRFTNLGVLGDVVGGTPAWRRHLPAGLFLLALAALLVGCARPEATVLVPRERATVVLVMDTSGSMRANDVRPSRLEAAQGAAHTFMGQLPQRFQVGLVSFSDTAQTLTQPTIDRTAVREAIDSLNAEGATAMGDALMEALRLNRTPHKRRPEAARNRPPTPTPSPSPRRHEARLDAVLLLSDGYNTSGEVQPLEAAARARALAIPVYTIALGTPDGVVQAPDAFGQMRLVQVPPDYDTLREIARQTDGQFFTAPNEDDLRKIYENLGSRIGFVEDHQEVTYAFAAAGLALAAAGLFLGHLWGPRLP